MCDPQNFSEVPRDGVRPQPAIAVLLHLTTVASFSRTYIPTGIESIASWSARIPFVTRCPSTSSPRKSMLSKSPSKIILFVAKPLFGSVTLVAIFDLLYGKVCLKSIGPHLPRLSRRRFRLAGGLYILRDLFKF